MRRTASDRRRARRARILRGFAPSIQSLEERQLLTAIDLRYDFGTSASPVAAGHAGVTEATAYAPMLGHGWTSGSRLSRDRAVGDALRRDFVMSADATFGVDLPSGVYDVTLTVGDASYAYGQMEYSLEGVAVATVGTAAGQYETLTFTVPVVDGQLTLRARAGAGTSYALVNAVTVATSAAAGPRAVGSRATGVAPATADRVVVTFSGPVAVGSFTLEDVVSLTGPSGAIAATGVNRLDATRYEVTFAPQTMPGSYALVVGPGVLDLAGNAMDQDGDGIKGESPGDRYTATFAIATPTASRSLDFGTSASPVAVGYAGVSESTAYSAGLGFGWISGATASRDRSASGSDALRRDFVMGADATFGVDLPSGIYAVTLRAGDASGAHSLMEYSLEGGVVDTISTAVGQVVERSYTVAVSDGQLTLRIRAAGGTANALINSLAVARADVAGPRVVASTPSDSVVGAVDRVTLTFSESIQEGSFTLEDVVSLTGPGGAIAATGLNRLDAMRYEVTFAPQSAPGPYSLVIGPGVLDLAGNAMDQDGDGIKGESPGDRYTATFAIATSSSGVSGPRVSSATAPGASSGTVDRVVVQFTGAVLDGSFTLADVVSLSGPSGPIAATAVTKLGASTYEVTFAAQSAAGAYALTLGPGIADPSGNAMDQDGDGVNGEDPGDRYTASFAIAPPPAPIRKFDFGTATSPVASGYTQVVHTTAYSAGLGHGWSSGTISSSNRATGSDLTRDLNFSASSDATFSVDLPWDPLESTCRHASLSIL